MRVSIGLLASLLFLLPAQGLMAQTVEVLACQNGGDEYSESTESILSGCLDLLFQSGIIATNERPRTLSPEAFADSRLGIDSAAAGYVDFLLSFFVSYGPSTAVAGRSVPLSLAWRVQRISDERILDSGSITPALDKAMEKPKFEAGLQNLGTELGKACLSLFTAKIGLLLPRETTRISFLSNLPHSVSLGQGVNP